MGARRSILRRTRKVFGTSQILTVDRECICFAVIRGEVIDITVVVPGIVDLVGE